MCPHWLHPSDLLSRFTIIMFEIRNSQLGVVFIHHMVYLKSFLMNLESSILKSQKAPYSKKKEPLILYVTHICAILRATKQLSTAFFMTVELRKVRLDNLKLKTSGSDLL